MGLNWLVSGGCGFIGSRLNGRLLARGCAVRVVDDLSVGCREDLAAAGEFRELRVPEPLRPGELQLLVADVREPEPALAACEGVDVVAHLAANTGVGPSVDDPRRDCMVNVIGTFNYLEAARRRRVGRFVFASSGAPLGECEPPIHEELAPHPVSPYGASKLAGEAYCSAYYRSFGLETVALRFGNVYGPGSARKDSVVARFIRRALAGDTLEVYGDGDQTRDFIYIDDLLDALLLAAERPGVGGEVFQIASAAETSVNELLERLLGVFSAAGVATPARHRHPPRTGDVRRNFSDTRKAAEQLGWRARTDLETGLSRTVGYFLDRHRPNP